MLARMFHTPEGFIGKALKGAAVVYLLQALDDAANVMPQGGPKG